MYPAGTNGGIDKLHESLHEDHTDIFADSNWQLFVYYISDDTKSHCTDLYDHCLWCGSVSDYGSFCSAGNFVFDG